MGRRAKYTKFTEAYRELVVLWMTVLVLVTANPVRLTDVVLRASRNALFPGPGPVIQNKSVSWRLAQKEPGGPMRSIPLLQARSNSR